MTVRTIDIVTTDLGRQVVAVNGEDAVAVIEPLLLLRDGPGDVPKPDGAICWDPDGPNGGAWVMRGRDVPDGWRWWWRDPDPGVRTPGVPDGLYWALPPDEPSTERVSLWMAIGRTPDHCPNDRIIEVGLDGYGPWFCTGPSIEPECRDYAVADDGTVEVLRDGDR